MTPERLPPRRDAPARRPGEPPASFLETIGAPASPHAHATPQTSPRLPRAYQRSTIAIIPARGARLIVESSSRPDGSERLGRITIHRHDLSPAGVILTIDRNVVAQLREALARLAAELGEDSR